MKGKEKMHQMIMKIEGIHAKRAYITFWADFHFLQVELIFGRLTCFDIKKNIVL